MVAPCCDGVYALFYLMVYHVEDNDIQPPRLFTMIRILRTLLRGFFLRCPNCGQGKMGRGFFGIRETCDACGVRFERTVGEGTGAMILLLSVSPIVAILAFLLLYPNYREQWLALLVVILLALVVGMLWLYRPMRGLWVGIIHLTGGLKRDDEVRR
jgi:uncharacterized protein (DUF983 family)